MGYCISCLSILTNFLCHGNVEMTIKIIEENDLKIYATKQNINNKIGLPSPFEDRNQFIIISGSMGSGKSTFMNSALTNLKSDGRIFAGCYTRVIYSTPFECFESEENHPMKGHVKSRLFHSFDEKFLTSVIEIAEENKKEGNTLLCIDDFSEEFKNLSTIRLLRRIIWKHRHLKLTVCLSCLSLKAIPKSLRALCDTYIIFKPKSIIECEGYVDEVFAMSKNEFLKLTDFVFDERYNFLFYNARAHLFYKNFNLLELPKAT